MCWCDRMWHRMRSEQAVAQQVHALDPQLPLSEVETMSEYLGDLNGGEAIHEHNSGEFLPSSG